MSLAPDQIERRTRYWCAQLEGALNPETRRDLQKFLGEVILPHLQEVQTWAGEEGDLPSVDWAADYVRSARSETSGDQGHCRVEGWGRTWLVGRDRTTAYILVERDGKMYRRVAEGWGTSAKATETPLSGPSDMNGYWGHC